MIELMNTTIREQLEKHGNFLYPNKGVSMRPLIKEGRDVMIIEKEI